MMDKSPDDDNVQEAVHGARATVVVVVFGAGPDRPTLTHGIVDLTKLSLLSNQFVLAGYAARPPLCLPQ